MKKTERNDPCPCGSGKKYKQCCLKRDGALASNKRAETVSIPKALQEAIAHHQAGRWPQAEAIYQQILQVEPNHPDALHLLGVLAHQESRNEVAVELIGKAILLNPAESSYYSNLGAALQAQGKLDEAAENYRQALALKPDYDDAHSSRLFALNYHPDLGAEAIYQAYQEYDALMGIPLRPTWRPHHNDRDPNRRLRVGYVSPDFRHHSCRSFLEPLLAHHDKTQVEVYAYAELGYEDHMTARYRSYVEHWIPTKGMSDEALAERIRSDGIDILVELAGHTAGNRLLVFARKPAPVSLSWLGYGYTTGLGAIDYYLTDEVCAPISSEALFAEQPWRIPTPAYAYRPNDGMGEVGSLPAQQRGYITFGTLARAVRVNHRTVRVWAAILKAVPNSRLVLDSSNFKDPAMQEQMAARFAEHGIPRERLEIGFHSPPWDTLRGMDIGLDCFPHNSGTTLFETLYMGVPYITLAGRPSVGRLGSTILQGVGHPEWIAESEDDYVAKAVELASNVGRLAEIRSTLRAQMEACPLRDEAGFARKVEEAYRGMWKIWCETASIPEALQEAIAHHQAGRWPQAEAIYQQILQIKPNHPDALHLLGVLAHQEGRNEVAVELIGKAIHANPSDPAYYSNLGATFQAQGKLDAAAESYRQALVLKPDYADAHYNFGNALKEQGKLDEAIEHYRQTLLLRPDYVGAHNNLGDALQKQGKLDEAVKHYRQALSYQPDHAETHNNLGNALKEQGKLDEAIGHYHQALSYQPDYAEAHNNLALALQEQGKLDEAIEHYHQALSFKPNFADAHNNLALALQEQGKLDEAINSCHKALLLKPDFADAHNNLGIVFYEQGKLSEAINSCHQALLLKPDYAEAHNNLGIALNEQGKLDEAIDSYHKALLLKPDFAEAHNNMGLALHKQGRLDETVKRYHHALALKPDFAEAHSNLGDVLQTQGKLDEAVERYYKALLLKPDYALARSNLLFALNYHPDLDAEAIYQAYQEYDALMGIPLRPTWRPHHNDRDPNRRLRIGYVSPDFRHHSCRSFLEPLLAHHDKTQVDVYAYAELGYEDHMTARYRSYVEHWIPTKGMSDEALAERIRSDGIDILVELAGHTAGNRLLVFARKPAPVSLSWLGYGYTTGLGAIDYYLTDEVCAPISSEALFAEQPWRIPTPAYAYRPNDGMGEVGSLPAQQRGYITFGTLTRAVRVNHRTVRVWAAILKAVPNSRLVLDSSNFKDPAMQEQMAARFAEHGIPRERLEIGFHSPPWDTLRGMDIGLDCFPHNSGTTLFETLYMGVPYITLAGRPSVGRLGSTILQGVGHPEWIAESEDDYVAKAVELASNVGRLAEIRSTLRAQMEACPLRDEAGFARKVEEAYRGMWKIWCETGDKT